MHSTGDISMTGADKRWWDYRELFNSREVRYRTMLVFAMVSFEIPAPNRRSLKRFRLSLDNGRGTALFHTTILRCYRVLESQTITLDFSTTVARTSSHLAEPSSALSSRISGDVAHNCLSALVSLSAYSASLQPLTLPMSIPVQTAHSSRSLPPRPKPR